MAYAHKKMGDSVRVLFVTDSSDKGWLKRRESAYASPLGLEESEYHFAHLKDKELYKERSRLGKIIADELKRTMPKNVIIPSYGGNADHIVVNEVSLSVLRDLGANIITGKSTQSIGLNPRFWEVFDRENIIEVISFYGKGGFGSEVYECQVGNLFALPERPLNAYVYEMGHGTNTDFRVFGCEPMRIEQGYRIPQLTEIFD